eukprot:767092-Hanusia_phi.AAC.3
MGEASKKKEIFTYEAPWEIYGMSWSVRPDKRFRIAVGSFIEEYSNKVQVEASGHRSIIQLNENKGQFQETAIFDHPYPTTKVSLRNLLHVEWEVQSGSSSSSSSVAMKKLLNNNKNSEFCAPLTSFDWNDTDPSIIGTSSIDTTCTMGSVWNIETGQAKTQLIGFFLSACRNNGMTSIYLKLTTKRFTILRLRAAQKCLPPLGLMGLSVCLTSGLICAAHNNFEFTMLRAGAWNTRLLYMKAQPRRMPPPFFVWPGTNK